MEHYLQSVSSLPRMHDYTVERNVFEVFKEGLCIVSIFRYAAATVAVVKWTSIGDVPPNILI